MLICFIRSQDSYICLPAWKIFLPLFVFGVGVFFILMRCKSLKTEKIRIEETAKQKIQSLKESLKAQADRAYKAGYERGKQEGKQEAEFEIATHLASELIERKHRGLLNQLTSLQKAIKARNAEIEQLKQRYKQLKEEKQKLLEEIQGYKDKYVDLTAKIRLPILLAGLGKRFEQNPADLPKVFQFCERKLKNEEIGDPK